VTAEIIGNHVNLPSGIVGFDVLQENDVVHRVA
jgi:hypothetical protein